MAPPNPEEQVTLVNEEEVIVRCDDVEVSVEVVSDSSITAPLPCRREVYMKEELRMEIVG